MNKSILLGLVAVALVAVGFAFFGSNSGSESDPEMTGVIFTRGEGQILVVVGLDDVDIPYDEMLELGKRAAYLEVTGKTVMEKEGKKIAFTDLQEGDAVRVWVTGHLAESYPEQGEAKRIVVID